MSRAEPLADPSPSPGTARQWCFKRNCSLTPRQLAGALAMVCVASLSVAGFFWLQGVPWIMPFTVLELLALGLAFVVYARHATDAERLELDPAHLVVEQTRGGRTHRVVFSRHGVRLDPRSSASALIGLREGARHVRCGHHIPLHRREQVVREIRSALARA